jgi:PadR family transcriptional regulator PadR
LTPWLYIIYYVDIMAKGAYLGEFEHIVLLTVMRLGKGAYGAVIRAEIERVTGRSPAMGAVHATLERLERKDWFRRGLASRLQSGAARPNAISRWKGLA